MKKQLIVVPRWGATPASDWYPWIIKQLAEQPLFQSVHVCNMPNPETPTIATWTDALLDILKSRPYALSELVLVGHSVGCHAVMHALQQLKEGATIDSAVFIAGWWDVDQPWESIKPWIKAAHNYPTIKASAKKITVLLSNNDPFTRDYRANALQWQERLAAEVRVIANAKHFNGAEEPEVLRLLSELSR
jgi:uncharacterized protein